MISIRTRSLNLRFSLPIVTRKRCGTGLIRWHESHLFLICFNVHFVSGVACSWRYFLIKLNKLETLGWKRLRCSLCSFDLVKRTRAVILIPIYGWLLLDLNIVQYHWSIKTSFPSLVFFITRFANQFDMRHVVIPSLSITSIPSKAGISADQY